MDVGAVLIQLKVAVMDETMLLHGKIN